MSGKIIQICVAPHIGSDGTLYALDEDGHVWKYESGTNWRRLT